MSVVVDGSPAGVTLVLVHGVGLDHTMWAPVASLLADHYRVVRYDLLGHGDAAPLGADAELGTFSTQLLGIVDGLHVARFVLVGFSLGALIAQRFTLDHPERVVALVMANSVFDRSAADRGEVLERVDAVRHGQYGASIEPAIERWFTPAFAAAEPAVIEAVRQRLLANDMSSYAVAYRIFATADSGLAAQSARITAPTLVLTGSGDVRSTPLMSLALAEAIPGARAVIVPGARHLLPLEDPTSLAALIDAFVAELIPSMHHGHRENA